MEYKYITKTAMHEVDNLLNQTSWAFKIATESYNIRDNHSLQFTEQNTCNSIEDRKVTLAEVVACVISILTVLENFVILVAITKGPKSLRKPPYWFIASLASADLLTGMEVVVAIFIPVGTSPLSRIVLKGMAVVTFIVSINSLLLVSVDRYLRIAHPADYERILTRKKIILLICLSWLVSIGLFLVAPLLGWSCSALHCCANNGMCVCKRGEFGIAACTTECSQSFVPFAKSYILSGVVYFIISIGAMVGFYVALFRVVKKKTFGHRGSGSSGDSKTPNQNSKSKSREMRLAKTLLITLGSFVVCWLPVMVLFVVDVVITYPAEQLTAVFDFALVPSVINSFLNPIIYSIRLPRMRDTVKRVALPCVFGGLDSGYWTTNTSLDRSFKRSSGRKRIERLKDQSVGGTSKSNPYYTRSRLASTKSLNSETSYSCTPSSNSVTMTTATKS